MRGRTSKVSSTSSGRNTKILRGKLSRGIKLEGSKDIRQIVRLIQENPMEGYKYLLVRSMREEATEKHSSAF